MPNKIIFDADNLRAWVSDGESMVELPVDGDVTINRESPYYKGRVGDTTISFRTGIGLIETSHFEYVRKDPK